MTAVYCCCAHASQVSHDAFKWNVIKQIAERIEDCCGVGSGSTDEVMNSEILYTTTRDI